MWLCIVPGSELRPLSISLGCWRTIVQIDVLEAIAHDARIGVQRQHIFMSIDGRLRGVLLETIVRRSILHNSKHQPFKRLSVRIVARPAHKIISQWQVMRCM